MKSKKKFEEFEKELTELITKYMDYLTPLQIIALLEVKKLTYSQLIIGQKIEDTFSLKGAR